MILIGRSPIGRNPDPCLNNLVHGHQVGCCDQGHEAGNELPLPREASIQLPDRTAADATKVVG